ncbi:MAG: hypothetical protein U0325_17395 [Polyangiales bacterium]
MALDDLDALRRALDLPRPPPRLPVEGRVRAVRGLTVRASFPGARVGDRAEILRRDAPALACEVIAFDDAEITLLAFDACVGVGPGDPVRPLPGEATVPCGEALLGRVLDGQGAPLDGRGPLRGPTVLRPVRADAPSPLSRAPVREVMATGVRVLDGLLPLAQGQRVGLFAGSGVGRARCCGQLVQVRGRRGPGGAGGRARAGGAGVPRHGAHGTSPRADVVVVATAEALRCSATAPPRWRPRWPSTFATRPRRAAADGLGHARGPRDAGRRARGGRASGTPRHAPERVRRAAVAAGAHGRGRGRITAVYTVLVEGGDLDEPVADEVRALLDGHVVLDRALLARGRVPPVDVLASSSRVAGAVASAAQRADIAKVRATRSRTRREAHRARGVHPRERRAHTDEALAKRDALERFLRARIARGAHAADETLRRLAALAQ